MLFESNQEIGKCESSCCLKEVASLKYICDVCGWVYDEAAGAPELGIAPGTRFEDVPEDFLCPLCSVGKDFFSAADE